MGVAAHLRSLRIRAGKSRADVAAQMHLNAAWIQDLERSDAELAATLTLFQAMELAAILGTDLRGLFGSVAAAVPHIPIIELPARIRDFLDRERLTLDAFESRVGWDVAPFLASPLQEAAELPLAFFHAVSKGLGIDWLALVADEHVE